MLRHNLLGSLVVKNFIAQEPPSGFTCGNDGGVGPDQPRSSFLQPLDQDFQMLLVLRQWNGDSALHLSRCPYSLDFRVPIAKIPQTPVEVNRVPLGAAQPFLKSSQTL